MKTLHLLALALAASALVLSGDAVFADLTESLSRGNPQIRSMGTLEFGPDGVLFVGDSRGGAVFAIDTDDRTPGDRTERFSVGDIEGKIAALLGTTADDVMIHDMAVNPVSRNVYVTVSRARAKWDHLSGRSLSPKVVKADSPTGHRRCQ